MYQAIPVYKTKRSKQIAYYLTFPEVTEEFREALKAGHIKKVYFKNEAILAATFDSYVSFGGFLSTPVSK